MTRTRLRSELSPPRRGGADDSGIALLIVLLAITLLTIVVIEFTDLAQVETHLALSARNALQATYLARSGVNVAEALVIVDAYISTSNDSLQDYWAKPYPPLPIGDGTVVFRVRDEARFLNLNDIVGCGLSQGECEAIFSRLFSMLGIDQRILNAIIDWIDAGQDARVTPAGAEQPYYLGLTPPSVVRNGPLLTLRELLLVRGVTPTVLARLEGFVTVLPPSRTLRVNINTAAPEVLLALSQELMADPGLVDRLIAMRETEAFTSLPSELPDALETALARNVSLLVATSEYFRIEAIGEINDVRRGIVELVKRSGKRLSRVTWAPSNATLALTSQLPSDFLATLPVLGER